MENQEIKIKSKMTVDQSRKLYKARCLRTGAEATGRTPEECLGNLRAAINKLHRSEEVFA